MTVDVPANTVTPLLKANTPDGKLVYFLNFSANIIYVQPNTPSMPTSLESDGTQFDFPVPAVQTINGVTVPGQLIIQNSGGDTTLVNAAWFAYQGVSDVNITVGRW